MPRRRRAEVTGWDLSKGSPVIVVDAQDGWKAAEMWDLQWFRRELGEQRQLLKWIGPIFTRQESLWDTPVWQASVAEYIDYIRDLEVADPDCEEQNAPHCPRVYLNGWPAFMQLPWLRSFLQNPSFVQDASHDLKVESAVVRDMILRSFTRQPRDDNDEEEIQKSIKDAYWELTKLFISPKGAITRLHYDNGGAHVWLSQVRGRKLFVCFSPEDTPHLHAFEGDEGKPSGSFIDPLAEDVYERWPDYRKATPYIAILEEGETLFAPQGWWHYTVALSTSITVMRNFHSWANAHEFTSREDTQVSEAVRGVLKANQERAQSKRPKTDEELQKISRSIVEKVRELHRDQRRTNPEPSLTKGREPTAA